MSDSCCQTTEDGSAICLTSPAGTCQSTPSEALIVPAAIPTRPARLNTPRWKSVIAFGVACITSPCCTPLIVPVVLALLVGTPAAAWIGGNLGLVYGALTLISVLSFGLAFWWTRQSGAVTPVHRQIIYPESITTTSVQPIMFDERLHTRSS